MSEPTRADLVAVLIGGPWDRREVTLSACPERIQVGDDLYHRLNDPDTGEYLGGYVAQSKASEVADDGAVLPCGCVPPCEGHHEDVS